MALVKRSSAVVIFMVLATLELSMAAVYKVGDSSGWTIDGNVDYNRWAASKTFHVGDTIVFEYDPKYHNVVQVSYHDFKACNIPATPRATYNKGNDSITIKNHGHYYFICGAADHCKQGQKVDIRVPRLSSVAATRAPSPSPSSSPSPSPSASETIAPSDSHHTNSAPLSLKSYLVGKIVAGLAVFVSFTYLAA